MTTRQELLDDLEAAVLELSSIYRSLGDTSFRANTSWTARDVLVHIVYWHESFARNTQDLAHGAEPRPLRGTYAELAKRSQAESREDSIDTLLARLATAQKTIATTIFHPLVTRIPYKAGSRRYEPDEHLVMVAKHIRDHQRKLLKAADARLL